MPDYTIPAAVPEQDRARIAGTEHLEATVLDHLAELCAQRRVVSMDSLVEWAGEIDTLVSHVRNVEELI